MTDLELAVLKALQGRYGKGHAITRERLEFEVNLWLDQVAPVKDRAIREAIETLRQTHATGARIMSSSAWSGYWLLDDYDEFDGFFQENRSRALNQINGLRKQRDLLKPQFVNGKVRTDQLELFDA